jgi:hypothetical protein
MWTEFIFGICLYVGPLAALPIGETTFLVWIGLMAGSISFVIFSAVIYFGIFLPFGGDLDESSDWNPALGSAASRYAYLL